MKKLLITLAFASVAVLANAQDLMSKKGLPILPEAGDWSIGISAVPFIDWAMDKTRVFSNTGVTSAGSAVNSQVPFTLVGLYVVDATTSYRGKLRIGFGSTTTDHLTNQDVATPANPPATVVDEMKTSQMNIAIGAGIQMNRGKGRLRGIYGAEIGFGIGSNDTKYTYGNPFNSTYNAPTSYDFTTGNTINGTRTTESKAGSTFNLNLDGFVGLEYFFAPKMSFSAEYNWGLMMSSTGAGSKSVEELNTTANGATVITTATGKSSSFGLDVSNINSSNTGDIVFHFYF